MTIKEFNDELTDLKIILKDIESLKIIRQQQIKKIDEMIDEIELELFKKKLKETKLEIERESLRLMNYFHSYIIIKKIYYMKYFKKK